MNYIYGYRNKITNKWYVGQTTRTVEERFKQHIYSATHPNDKDYNSLLHRKIREYGQDAFEIVLLEEVEDKANLDVREQFWIAEKHSYVKDNGYNLTSGGQQRKQNENYLDSRSSFNPKDIESLIKKIKESDLSLTHIAHDYNVSLSLICMINSGKKYYQDNEQYPLRQYKHTKVTEEEVDIIIDLLQQNYSNKEIADILSVDADVIYRINTGKAHRRNLSYPIRDKEKDPKVCRANKIKALLKEGKLNNRQIADLVHCDPSVVSNINYGKVYKDSSLSYPLRK